MCANTDKHQALAQQVKATWYCVNDKVYLCDSCNSELHSGSAILRDHTRYTISGKSEEFKDFGVCPNHVKRYEFFNTETC